MSSSNTSNSQQSFIAWARQTESLDPTKPSSIAVIDAFIQTTSETDHKGRPFFNNARFVGLCKSASIFGKSLDKAIATAQKCFHHPRMGFFFELTSNEGLIGKNIQDKEALKRIRLSFSNACTKNGRLESVFRDIDTEAHKGTIPPEFVDSLKRAAASFFSERSLSEIFRETKRFAQNGYTNRKGETIFPNTLSASRGMKNGTALYAEPTPLSEPNENRHTHIVIVNQDSIDAALDPKNNLKNPCILNIANAFSPGGNVEHGAKAQEEDLFRRTNYFESLYPECNPKLAAEVRSYQTTKKGEEMEESRPLSIAAIHRDDYLVPEYGGIYSPNVCVFRNSDTSGFELMDRPSLLSFVAVAPYNRKTRLKTKLVFGNPNYGPLDRKTYEKHTKRKIRAALRIAATHNHQDLVLGAFGCGISQNNPNDIAQWYGEILQEDEFKNRFAIIVFAILDKDHSKNFASFYTNQCLAKAQEESIP